VILGLSHELQCEEFDIWYALFSAQPGYIGLPLSNGKSSFLEAKEPAFLRKLRQQHAGSDPARHERRAERPQLPKRLKMGGGNGDEGDDDAPTYVDSETNEIVSREVYRTLVGESSSVAENDSRCHGDDKKGPKPAMLKDESIRGEEQGKATGWSSAAQLVDVGKRQKRRIGKAIGGKNDAEADDAPSQETTEDASAGRPQPSKQGNQAPSKGRKKIKLSFDPEQ
jgi:hypothetical protein